MVDCLQRLPRYCTVPCMRFLYLKGIELQPDSEEEEVTFSGADDGKPKPNRVAKFAKYLKKNSENGATALREECGVRRLFCVCVCFIV